ncbi:MAG: hypothetical protein HQK73_01485 [Desulfamplus sp.]|nr:hypothetical protein [Desulfamplus sp.]MBF0412828.1 hypothetical protein [Desulfamplus sp.]
MSTIQPHGENLRKAVQWLSEEKQSKPDQNLVMLAEKAAIKFDLNPDDSEFLLRFIKEPLK